ncbi:hypothetical protein Tco_0950099 [Tanacetum coccineum]
MQHVANVRGDSVDEGKLACADQECVRNLLKKTGRGKDESSSRGEGGKKKTSTFVSALSSIAFGKHLEEKHCVEAASQSPLTSSMIEGNDVTTICDDVKVADLKNPMEDSAG